MMTISSTASVSCRIFRATFALVLSIASLGAHAAAPPCPTIEVVPVTSALPSASLQTAYSQTFTASGSAATPYKYTVTSGLPAGSGLALNGSTGVLSGTPTQGGEFLVTITATDANGCSGGRTYVLDVVPSVIGTTPANNATSVSISSAITINFSEAVNVGAGAFSLECPSGTPVAFTQSPTSPGGATSFVLTPTANLPSNGTCAVKVTAAQVTSVADSLTMAADYSFSFSTGSRPAVTSTTPLNNATNVATTTDITLTFNESVNASPSAFTLECPTGTPQTFSTSASPAATFTLTPTSALPAGAVCTVTALAAQITDAATSSVHPAADYSFSFTVDAAPTVTSTTPITGANNVALNSAVTFTFDKPVNVSASSFTLECPVGTPVGFTISPAPPGATTVFTLTPSGNLPPGVTCVATAIAAQIADLNATHMAANVSVLFTTDTPPTVTSTTPTNGATSIAGDTTVSIVFSKAVNVTSSAFTLQCPTGTPETFATSPAPPGGVSTFTLTPTTILPAGTVCTVTVIANQVTDTTAGTAMTSNYVFTFTTDAAPTVVSTSPNNGATIVDTSSVSFTFSKAVNVTSSAFTLQCPNGSSIPFTLTPAPPGATTTFTLTPTTFMPPDTSCVATAVASQITDLIGTHFAANFPLTFNTVPPPPVATNDTYPQNVIGNVSTNSSLIGFSATANDTSQTAFTITAFTATSANGGNVSMTTSGAGMGQFTYNPPAGFEGTDTFTYTITNTGGSATGTVSIPVAGMIWFIDNTAGAGDGRLSSPFNTLAAFQTINDGTGLHPAVNDNIFLYDSGTTYSGPLVLLNGQKLVGQDATVPLAVITGLTPGTASAPLPATNGGSPNKVNIGSATTAVTVGSGNTIWGLMVGNAPTIALNGPSIGTLKLRDLSILNASGPAVHLSNGVLDAIVTKINATGGAHGIALATTTGSFDVEGDGASDPANATRGRTTAKLGGGTLTLGSGGTIQNATGSGILLTGATNVTLRNVVVQNNGSGVSTGSDGITATGSSGLLLDNAFVTGHVGNSGLHASNAANLSILHSEFSNNATNPAVDGGDTWNVRLDAITGTATLNNSLFFNSHENVIGIVNNGSTTLAVNANNDNIHDATANTCLYLEAQVNAQLSLALTNSTVNNCSTVGVLYNGNNASGGGTFTVTGSTFDGNGGNNVGGADIAVAHQGTSKTVTFDIESNTTRQSFVSGSGTSISVDLGGLSNATTLLTGKIINNTIGSVAVLDSGSEFGAGIALQANGAGKIVALVNTNTVRQASEGLAVLSSGSTDEMDVSVHGNSFVGSAASANVYTGLELTAGGSGSGSDTICANVGANASFDASVNGVAGVIADAITGSNIHLQGYGGAANNNSQIVAFLNTTATVVNPTALFANDGGTVSGQTTCPSLP